MASRNCKYSSYLIGPVMVACMTLNEMTCAESVTAFFPGIGKDLSRVTWAHAVNSLALLNATLANNTIMMIEVDVVLGTLNGTTEAIPILAHPPASSSDLSLDMFLKRVTEQNNGINATNTTSTKLTKKGVKLDFKTIEAFNQSIVIIKSNDMQSFPIWLNADILPGPINSTELPVNADQFLNETKNLGNCTLSLGWKTNLTANSTGGYTDGQIDDMVKTIKSSNVSNEITFAVRSALAAESLPQMKKLLNDVENSTLTLWSSETDKVNVTNLRKLIREIGVAKIYIDVPESLRNELNQTNQGNNACLAAKTSVILSLLTFFFVIFA